MVGAQATLQLAMHTNASIALVDKFKDLAVASAMDIEDGLAVINKSVAITAGDDFSLIDDSDIVVVTAGFPRKENMSREDLIRTNLTILRDVCAKIAQRRLAPNATLIVVTNPLDIMTYVAFKTTGLARNRVIGAAGTLDVARFKLILSKNTGLALDALESCIVGPHSDAMVILASRTTHKGRPIAESAQASQVDTSIREAKVRGGSIVGLFKNRSASVGPGMAVRVLCEAILENKKITTCCACNLAGEYGLDDVCIGVPATVSGEGVIPVGDMPLGEEEKKDFLAVAKTLKEKQHAYLSSSHG